MINVLAGIIGALLGFSGALLGAWIKSRAEHGKWLRDQKLSGAAEMVSAGTSIFEFRSGSHAWVDSFEPSELREWQAQLQRGRAVVHTLCAEETRDHANAFVKACWRAEDEDAAIQALQAFTASLRREIGSS
ncbi:hypothetical protein ABT337_31555 [Saccharopolyspora hirsuta]|uniref:hypothetical protein n=1 Tax=Saccharopolyspora hirsuta TaxID=1837 RepID=UPI001893828D|nr:hypothetical protein [Nocardia farcinica]